MFGMGPWEMAAIAVVLLIVFGNRLPEAMRNLGRSVLEFKRGMRETENSLNDAVRPEQPAAEKKPPESDKT
ncbi:MAG TPA: twin-arginine translocase TatA/TatE family subunit [Planctomycetota bacterium]|nr:twin-arginine translocase TatA/TatE family subunit [Planctomycetota bacterium]